MKLSTVCIALITSTSVSALSTRESSRLVARADEVPNTNVEVPVADPNNDAAKQILDAVAEAARKKAMEKGKEIIDKKTAELKAKAEASIADSKRIALEIFESLKQHSLMKIKEIVAQLLQLIKEKVNEALTKGKQATGEIVNKGKQATGELVDKKKEAIKSVIDDKLGNKDQLTVRPGNLSNPLSARDFDSFDSFDLESRTFLDDAMVQIFTLLKRSGLINNIIRQSLTDPQVRAGVADITVELIDARVIPYDEVFEALMSSGMAIDVVRYSLTDQETRSGLVQLVIELIPELFRSGVLNPWDYINGDFVANGSNASMSSNWTTATSSAQPVATSA